VDKIMTGGPMPFAIQKFKDKDTQKYNFASGFV
jgi:hypothetical protein